MTEQSKPVPEDHINVGRNEVTAALPEAVSKIEDPSSPTVKTTPDLGNTKPASLFSAETIKSQGSAWYSPWGWYATSPVVPSSPGAKKVEQLEDAHKHAHSKTESEMVKEEALAREDLPTLEPNTTHQTQATLSPSEEVTLKPSSPSSSSLLNPIESSISTQRSGWASFFMSNTLLTKTITNESHERDENGMEVMEVDEGEDKEETPKPDERQAGPSQAMMIVAGKKRQATSLPSSPTSKSPPSRPRTSKEREPKKSGPPAPPLTNSETIKNETANPTMARSSSPTPSGKSGTSTPGGPNAHPPNLVLPTWKDTFLSAPRSNVPPPPTPPATQKGKLGKTFDFVSGVLFSGSKGDERAHGSVKARGKQKERNRDQEFLLFGNELPKALDIIDQTFSPEVLNEKCRVVVIGVAGWSPGAVIRTIAGGLPSSSSKFVDMSCSALEKFEEDHGFKFKKITKIPLEGDGTIERKVAKVHTHLLGNEQWVDDLHAADVIFVATHSQGSIVATHLLDKLIREGHILTPRNVDTLSSTAAAIVPGGSVPLPASLTRTQKICCLALCGIHLGPLRYLKTSSLLQPYIQYFENAAAGELFDFQNTETPVSQNYVKALRTVMDHGTKMVYVASLNDQVVPIYSGLFTAASHPRILRALYIDGDAYHSSDFLSNLLVLLIRIMNSGLSDSGLLAHLSEATAGTLSGVGHSTAYEEPATYSLAVDYLFLTTDGTDERTDLVVEGFNAVNEQNDYEIPWSLRDLIADDRVAHFFADEFSRLRNAFDDWSPKTTILRDIKRKLQPIQRLSSIRGTPLTSRL
ncbi:hypothetical protein EW026_g6205 [Hermanssonia centrifuga]|uniref:YMC020W-like alpha/beta hydrolase domain-containing protein n=1 Tax=Hermanssonia centrifuga TaxID=98765 RepID=A0A4S4KBR3_9APHY|nr:hypothetical protein EW026_g6205 [Hermanssonia centrifuga]